MIRNTVGFRWWGRSDTGVGAGSRSRPRNPRRSSRPLLGTGGSGGLVNGVNGNQTGVTSAGVDPLANYGGPVQTMALLPWSPAIGFGTYNRSITTDERGFPRGFGFDIGAYQYNLVVESADGSVNTNIDDLTLPGAVSIANSFKGPVGVYFDPEFFFFGFPINLTSGVLEIKSNVPIFSMVGGGGPNTITGNGNDIMISGTTSYGTNTATNIMALDAILAEWSVDCRLCLLCRRRRW